MKQRILVAVIFVPLLFAVMFFAPAWAFAIVTALIAALSAWELIAAVGAGARKRICLYGAVGAAAVQAGVLLGRGDYVFRIVLFLLMVVMFVEAIRAFAGEHPIPFAQIAAVIFAWSSFRVTCALISAPNSCSFSSITGVNVSSILP